MAIQCHTNWGYPGILRHSVGGRAEDHPTVAGEVGSMAQVSLVVSCFKSRLMN